MLTLLSCLRDWFRARFVLQAEILALRHQLLVLQRTGRGHRWCLGWADRLGLALAVVERLAVGIAHRQTRDGHRLASQGFSTLLEVERRRSPNRMSRSSQSHSSNEPCQPAL